MQTPLALGVKVNLQIIATFWSCPKLSWFWTDIFWRRHKCLEEKSLSQLSLYLNQVLLKAREVTAFTSWITRSSISSLHWAHSWRPGPLWYNIKSMICLDWTANSRVEIISVLVTWFRSEKSLWCWPWFLTRLLLGLKGEIHLEFMFSVIFHSRIWTFLFKPWWCHPHTDPGPAPQTVNNGTTALDTVTAAAVIIPGDVGKFSDFVAASPIFKIPSAIIY